MSAQDEVEDPGNAVGGYAPALHFCPHADGNIVQLPYGAETKDLEPDDNQCADCANKEENWLCLSCHTVHCGRFASAHSRKHSAASGHLVACGLTDLSFWCYACNSYLHHLSMRPVYLVYSTLHLMKFGEEAVEVTEFTQPSVFAIEEEDEEKGAEGAGAQQPLSLSAGMSDASSQGGTLRSQDEVKSDAAAGSDAAIPTIDLSLPVPLLASLLHRACEQRGFFYLVNHGVPAQLLERLFELSRLFFDLPLSVKQRYLANRHNRGYTPTEDETLDEQASAPRAQRGDSKESFYWSTHRALDPTRPLWGPNVRVSDADVHGLSGCLDAYMAAVSAVGLRLTELLYVALHGGRDDEGNWARKAGCFDDPTVVLRLLRYDERLSDAAQGQLACGAHTDWGMLTLLATDDQPGLQLWERQPGASATEADSGRWLSVPPVPGAFIVNLGDMLERWTNGRYRSTLHRVVNTTGRPRYSIPLFYEPNFDCVVDCLASCVDEQHLRRYTEPVTAGRYLAERYAATQKRYADILQSESETKQDTDVHDDK